MANRPRRRARSKSFKADPVNYQLGQARRSRSESYNNVYLRSQLQTVQNHMQMASTQLGNDYNLELHKISTLQDEMIRIDDLIAGWHDTEVAAAAAVSANMRSDRDYKLKLKIEANSVTQARSALGNTAAQAADKMASMPEQTRNSIQALATHFKDMVYTDVNDMLEGVITKGEFSNLASLKPLQRQEAAVALKESLLSRAAQIPQHVNSTQDIANITSLVKDLTGVEPAAMTAALYASNKATFVARYKRENSRAGGAPKNESGPDGGSVSGSVSDDGKPDSGDILKSLMERRKELEAELSKDSPDSPTYEDVRSLANEQYQPRKARETRRDYKTQVDSQEQMREMVSGFPKDQRILMQAGRKAQRSADGDESAITELTGLEGDAASFIMDQLQNGTLSMKDIIPYATRIAEAGQMDGSPEDIVSARDRILSESMSGLMSNYRNTLPSADVNGMSKKEVPPPSTMGAQPNKTPPGTQLDTTNDDLSFLDQNPLY